MVRSCLPTICARLRAMMSDQERDLPRILIIAGFPPEGGGGGGAILRSLLADFPVNRLAWLALQADVTATTWWRPDIMRWGVTRRLPGRARIRIVQRVWAIFGFRWEAAQARSLARRIKAIWRPDQVWVVVDQNSLWAAGSVVRDLGLPWHVTVHDDPSISRRLQGYSLPQSWQKVFGRLYTQALTRDCISHGMVNYYRTRYGSDAFVAARTIDSERLRVARARPILRGERIEILMGGGGDCPPPWPENLIGALQILSCRTGRKVRLNAFDPALRRFEGDNVRVLPRMQEAQFDEFLAQMDLGYAPDPMAPEFSEFVTTSLSTKVVTYVAATLPSLYHGPRISSVGEMFSRHTAGVIVEGQASEEIAAGFVCLIEGAESFRDACCDLAKADFDRETLVNRIYRRFQSVPLCKGRV